MSVSLQRRTVSVRRGSGLNEGRPARRFALFGSVAASGFVVLLMFAPCPFLPVARMRGLGPRMRMRDAQVDVW